MRKIMNMKNSFTTLLFLLIISVVSNSFAKEVTTVKLSEDPWPPYTLGEEGRAPTGGIAVDIMNAIFKKIDVKIDMELFPWKRCLFQMKHGIRDGLMLLTKNKDREKYMVYSELIMEDRDLLWYVEKGPSETKTWKSYEDFKNLLIGETAGFNYGKEFNDAKQKFKLRTEVVNTDFLNFKKLLAGRTDLFICNERAANSLFKNHPTLKGKFKAYSRPTKLVKFYMAISKQSPALSLIPNINKAIRELKADGTIDKIVK